MKGVSVHFHSLTQRFRRDDGAFVTPIDGLTLTLEAGSVTALLGRSGCGKTTLLRITAGLLAPTAGRVEFVPSAPRVGMVFQEPKLLPWKTVAENVALAVRHLPEKERNDRVAEVLERVGLSAWKDALPGVISGGMAQRAGLARALVADPAILLMDEPFGALDALTRLTLQDECLRLFEKSDMTVFLITHDAREAPTACWCSTKGRSRSTWRFRSRSRGRRKIRPSPRRREGCLTRSFAGTGPDERSAKIGNRPRTADRVV